MYSGREFAWLYERCDQLAFLDGHVLAFSYIDGVVKRCVYDNLKPAVAASLVRTGCFQAASRRWSIIICSSPTWQIVGCGLFGVVYRNPQSLKRFSFFVGRLQ